jgi:hypothetical protein
VQRGRFADRKHDGNEGRRVIVRPFELADEPAVIALWERCGLTRSWNDPRKDIRRKLDVRPDLFLVGVLEGRVVASVMAGYEGHRGWINYLQIPGTPYSFPLPCRRFPPSGDVVRDAGRDARHGFSSPPRPLRKSVWCPRNTERVRLHRPTSSPPYQVASAWSWTPGARATLRLENGGTRLQSAASRGLPRVRVA